MHNNVFSETRLTLAEAAKELDLHVATIWRWTRRGVRGIKLESISIGHLKYTSREALERFSAATTAAANGEAPPARTPAQRERAIRAAEAELAAP